MEDPGAKGEASGSWIVGGTRAGQTGNRKQFLGQGWEWHLAGVYPGNIGKGMGSICASLFSRTPNSGLGALFQLLLSYVPGVEPESAQGRYKG